MNLFTSPAPALGALYAFEAQQPGTARSKLEGLRAHYDVSEAGTKYFVLHAVNWEESGKILEQMENLSPAEQAEACLACSQMAESLWSALTEIHDSTMRGN
jgi:pyrroloquinoline quinone (PQQ) biosynthesis protein C